MFIFTIQPVGFKSGNEEFLKRYEEVKEKLQQDSVQSLSICKSPLEEPAYGGEMCYRTFKSFNPGLVCSPDHQILDKAQPLNLPEDQLPQQELEFLCGLIKQAENLSDLVLITRSEDFTEREEQVLIAAIQENSSIQRVELHGGSTEMVRAIEEIKRNRPGFEFISSATDLFRDKGRALTDERLADEQHVPARRPVISAHLVYGFAAVLGAAAVATAWIALELASLNPAGVALAVSGAMALTWGAYSFFTSPPEARTPPPAEPMGINSSFFV